MTPLLYTDGPRLGKLVFYIKPYNLHVLAMTRRAVHGPELDLIFDFPFSISHWSFVDFLFVSVRVISWIV